MTTQEISLIVVLVVIAVYVIAAMLSRSKIGEEPADIILEARLPLARKPDDGLIPAADPSLKNTKKPRRKPASASKETPATFRTQQHHASPMPPAKSDRKTKQREQQAPRATAPDQKSKPKPEPDPSPAEVIDPELTGQISELDDRLDAIEKLVASIEESLATFEPLEDSPAGEARAA